MIRFRPRLSWLLPAFLLALTIPALAYDVAPMIYDLTPSGPGAATVLRVANDSDKPITIELVAEKRTFDEKGVESRTPADDDFVLFPPQAVIAPGATQAVRVQYVGPATLARSETYTITVKQVPVTLPSDSRTGVQFLFNFSTLANIVPQGAKADVRVVALEPMGGAGGYRLRLRNQGTRYTNLSNAKIAIGEGAAAVILPATAWRKALGSAWLLPGLDRVVELPAELKLPAGARSASVEPGRNAG